MALSSDDVNLLLYRYLMEAGFSHSAFVFGHESGVARADADGRDVAYGALVSFVQKGIMYMELEANLARTDDVYGEYTPLSASDVLTRDLGELRLAVREMREARRARGAAAAAAAAPGGARAARGYAEVPPEAVSQLAGHAGELIAVAWSEAAGALASGSADGGVRIWGVGARGARAAPRAECAPPPALAAAAGDGGAVVRARWSPDGATLAAATKAGPVLLWAADGAPRGALEGHAGPAVHLEWAPGGGALLSAGAGGVAIVWDAAARAPLGRWELCAAGQHVLGVSWRPSGGAAAFAAGCQDGGLAVCEVGAAAPLARAGAAHGAAADGAPAAVNAVAWAPGGELLASGGDDAAVRLWAPPAAGGGGGPEPAAVLRGHRREVVALAWGGGGGGEPLLASSSNDGAVRLWRAGARGAGAACVHVLDAHGGEVPLLAWAPAGAPLLAASDGEGNVAVWDAASGGLLRALRTPSGRPVADVAWVAGGAALALAVAEAPRLVLADLGLPEGAAPAAPA